MPYLGLVHDSILYFGQTLGHIVPERLARDPFLSLSQQDRFTALTRALAWFYGWASPGAVNMALVLASQAASAWALFRLVQREGRASTWAGLIVWAAALHMYGPGGFLAFGERFLTARALAEPLALWALVFARDRRYLVSVFSLLASALLHPLIAAPAGLLMLAWYWTQQIKPEMRRSVLRLLPAVVLLTVIMLLFFGNRFGFLWERFDPAWGAAVRERNPIFVANYRPMDFGVLAFDALVLGFAARWLTPGLAALARLTLNLSILAIGITAWGADLLNLVFITQLQTWRVQWLAHALALMLLPAVLLCLAKRPSAWARPTAVAALVCASAALSSRGTLALPILWLGLHLVFWRIGVGLRPKLARWILVASLALMALVAFPDAVQKQLWWSIFAPHVSLGPWRAAAAQWPIWLLLAWGLVWLQGRGKFQALPGLCIAAGLAGTGALNWDARSALVRSVEALGHKDPHPWRALVEPNSPVHWERGTAAIWGLLQLPEYYSHIQGAASVFDRRLALLHLERGQTLKQINDEVKACIGSLVVFGQRPSDAACEGSPASFESLCQTEPKLRYFVLSIPIKSAVISSWRPETGDTLEPTYYLHDCQRLRAQAP